MRKNSFHNLALPLFTFSETIPPIRNVDVAMDPILFCPVKAVPPKWTSWDKLDVQGPCTVQEMIDKIKELYGLDVSMIILGTKTVWANFMKGFNHR